MRALLLAATLALAACQTSTEPVSEPAPEAAPPSAAEASGADTTGFMPTRPMAEPMTPETEVVAEGTFAGASGHDASGRAALLRLSDGSYVVRLEGLEVDNGPDLRVWAVRDLADKTAGPVDLGALKSTRGDHNYAVPAGALGDGSEVAGVSVWCRAFSVEFGTAPLG